ncbi:methyl-accepting chemotaxis protein [Stakelama pacifica]|uniref:Methyl-accepting chemotaxis protein (MCP) signaling protein n=1 Tax=Stakelama pacifica TaxID=517720 RepID=A0A4R6FNI7_9SPHN|nr:methyl-accepting chemotaxis protein [Stakelama pacifica]TDN82235.1 methyl-accepting chemotaxis protein (MCP) signaling protein [Stakelama pacifica]
MDTSSETRASSETRERAELQKSRDAAIDVLIGSLPEYDRDGAVSAVCAEISELSDADFEAVADIILRSLWGYISSDGQFGAVGSPAYQRQIAESRDYLRLKYRKPLSREWLRAALRNIGLSLKFRVPLHAFIAAIALGHSHLMELLYRRTEGDAARATKLCDVVQRLAMAESAVMVEHSIHERDYIARKEQEDRSRTFREDIGSTLDLTAGLGNRIRAQSKTASESVDGMLEKASEVAIAADQSAIAMRDAAGTAAGLIRAIDDARNEVEDASGIATQASKEADLAAERSEMLNEHAKSIESILAFIREIAGQTNLLALNATIEAARAGDAGRGFAVVAQEVKSLASQTARATDEIAAKVAAIQEDIRETVRINASVSSTVGTLRDRATQIRSAMENQSHIVTSITASVDETALSADAMSNTIAAIRRDIESVTGEVTALSRETAQVDEQLARLKDAADRFSRSGAG